MKRWKVILAAGLIFASGMVTGALAMRAANQQTRGGRDRDLAGFGEPRPDFLKKMQAELNLTPQQSTRIDVILQDAHKRLRQIWETTCQPQVREERKRVRDRIHAELDEDQRSKYDALVKRAKEPRPVKPEGEPRGNGTRLDHQPNPPDPSARPAQ